MCGIAGILNLNGAPVEAMNVKRMCDVMAHRGPDDEGMFLDGSVGLGHRRLSIIDLSDAGHQPMFNEDRTIALVFNGEVYNFRELRKELELLGHVFASQTDTEVVIHAYESWGEKCVLRFNGMFAFGLWDSRKRQLFLARDRYGIKPLYYHEDAETFTFASEIKPILTQPNVRRRLSLGALDEYFTFQNIYTDRTLFEGIKTLPAGTWATVVCGHFLGPVRYWDWDLSHVRSDISFVEASEETRRLFEQAVTRQLVSDVPVGAYLSGGMDSGSIVAVASRTLPHMPTFTGGFDLSSVSGLEVGFDERKHAETMASAYRTQQYEMVMHSGDMALVLPRLTWHLEDLRMGMSYANWYAAHLASKFVKVVLSGTGGDELFAGYPWRYAPLMDTQTLGEFDDMAFRYWQRLVPEEDRGEFFTDECLRDSGPKLDILHDVMRPLNQCGRQLTPETALTRALYFEAKTFLHGLFIVEDKISMAQSLEVRVPFLDNDLVDFVLTLPACYKLNIASLNSGKRKGPIYSSDGKFVLRDAMRGLVPDMTLNRAKQGFSSPDGSWYRGETMGYIKDILLCPKTLNRGYFQPAYIRRIVDEHTNGKINHRLLIWSLLSFEHWNRLFLDGCDA